MQHQDTALGRMMCMQPLWELSVRTEVQIFLARSQADDVLILLYVQLVSFFNFINNKTSKTRNDCLF